MAVIANVDMFRRGGSVQQIDSQYQFDPSAWATYEAARVQADAAIRAAEIGAQAAMNAAEIGAQAAKDAAGVQLDAAIMAALAALLVGCLTYLAAILAADWQTKLEREKYKSKVKAYSVRQSIIIVELKERLSLQISEVTSIVEKYHIVSKKAFSNICELNDFEIPNEWKDDKWEEPHMIGDKFAMQLITTKHILNRVNCSKKYLQSFSTGEHEVFTGSYVFEIYDGDLPAKKSNQLFVFKRHEKDLWECYKSLSNLYETLPEKFSGNISNPDEFLGYVHNSGAS